jgi:hypothetical protein
MFKTEELFINGDDMPRRDAEAVAEIIYDALVSRGIAPDSYSWHIEVTVSYDTENDLTPIMEK